jgi:phosphate/sulfate permease
MNVVHMLDQVFAGGTTLAGLMLVFLGGVLTGYDSYDTAQKKAVRDKYKRRARLTLIGFSAALLSAALALLADWVDSPMVPPVAVVAFIVSFVLLMVVAVAAVTDI